MLSNRLGEREYFFGRTPSTLDAVIFSYLALLLKVSVVLEDCVSVINKCFGYMKLIKKLIIYCAKDNPLLGGGQPKVLHLFNEMLHKL